MEFVDVVRRRHMVRHFTAEPVDPLAVDRLLALAVRAPNAGFAQGWAFLVLDRPADLDRFWFVAAPGAARRQAAWLAGMRTAPTLVVVLTSAETYLARYREEDKSGGRAGRAARAGAVAGSAGAVAGSPWSVPYWHVDAGMAALLMLLGAVEEGLGACFFGVPPERVAAVRAAFAIPDDHEPTGVVALGTPDPAYGAGGSPTRRPRRPLSDVVHRGSWQGERGPTAIE